MAELIYGFRVTDGEIVSINEVPSGLDCNCICPNCKAPLKARKGKKNEHHFAHHSKKCDAIYANQTALHLMAKAIIAKEKKISVPVVAVPLESIKLGRIPPGIRAKLPRTYEYRQAEILNCQSVDLEKHLTGFVPDIIANTSNSEYLIEIAVTHFVDEEKKTRAIEYNAPMLEIDLSRFVKEPISSDELRKNLIESNELREWIHHPDYEEAKKQAQAYYEGLQIIQDYHKKQKKEEAARRKLEEEQAERMKQRELAREAARRKLEEEQAERMKQRELAREAARVKQRELLAKNQQEILNFDFNQEEINVCDLQNYMMAKCMYCEKIMRAYTMIIPPGSRKNNLRVCYSCYQQKK